MKKEISRDYKNGESDTTGSLTMPEQDEFAKQLAEWEKQASGFLEQSQIGQEQLTTLTNQMDAAVSKAVEIPGEAITIFGQPLIAPPVANILRKLGMPIGVIQSQVSAKYQEGITQAEASIFRNNFYQILYSEVPVAISGGQITSVDDAVALLPWTLLQESWTPAELEDIKSIIENMISAITGVPSLSEMAADAEGVVLPALVAPEPTPSLPLAGVHRLTVSEIAKSFLISPPEAVMSEKEWTELLEMEGYSGADLEQEAFIQGEADRLVKGWAETANNVNAYRSGKVEMPEYTITDMLKEAIVQPGLALLEVASMYFEHVSQPLAGLVWKTVIPDIEAEYQRLRKTESTWQALQMAWEDWDAPFEGSASWILKYILMEGLTDPLTYVGWGIATRITRPIPYIGKLVGATERGAAAVLELPFDLIKSGIKKLPKTPAQRALLAQAKAGQFVDHWLTTYTGKHLTRIAMQGPKSFQRAIDVAIKYTRRYPHSESKAALAGKELLKHSPVDEATTKNWMSRIDSTIADDDISKEMVGNLNMRFEDFFTKRVPITIDEAATEIIRILSPRVTENTHNIAKRLLQERAEAIIGRAYSYGEARSANAAMRALMKNNYNIHLTTENSLAFQSAKEIGAYSTLLMNVSNRVQKIWINQIDRLIIRPTAEAYLTFGMYGPMNVIEDVIRSLSDHVVPRRMNVESFELRHIGLSTDPGLKRAGLSEMMGELWRGGDRASWSNWILQLGGLAKNWGRKTYEILVERPGGIGMDIRRNFVYRREMQLLKELGGEQYENVARITPRPPDIADKKLSKQFVDDMGSLRFSGPDGVRTAKNDYTRAKLLGREVDNILREHPDIPNPSRISIKESYNDGSLLVNGGRSIDKQFSVEASTVMDEFLKGPEYAAQEFGELAEFLTRLEVTNPQEMAQALQQVNIMSQIYGATPEQMIGRITARSKGLPFTDRKLAFDIELDRIHNFIESAGGDIGRVVTKLRRDLGVPANAFNEFYATKSSLLLDIMTTQLQHSRQFRLENMGFRREYFAVATKADMKSSTFWDNFYNRMTTDFHTYNRKMAELNGILASTIEQVDMAAGIRPFARRPVRVVDRPISPSDVAAVVGARGDDISRALMDVMVVQNDRDMFIEYVLAKVRPEDVGFTRENIGQVYDQIVSSLRVKPEDMSHITKIQLELEAARQDIHNLYNAKLLPDNEIAEIHRYVDELADGLEELMFTKVPPRGRRPGRQELKPEYANFNELRQKAYDEAEKWYFKAFTDYTNANAFDAVMKNIYPYWTYETQRWFWLPRSFMKHPGTLTSFERWQDNSDFGYIHIPGTSIDWNPFRGTVYGTLTTRLTRRDFPEYYDQLGAVGEVVEFSDFLSRYGFYPGAHIAAPLAFFGGLEQQMGETLPAIWKTPLNAAIAMFPDNEAIKFISEKVFPDRFRDYMAILMVNKQGGDGTNIFTKMELNLELTEEEEAMWTAGRQEAAKHGIFFEQFGLFRLRTDEQWAMYEQASQAIEDMTGFTIDQQDWLRKHGYRIWDMVGGMSPTQQAILQELDYYQWIGSVRPLLPSRQQLVLNRLEMDWDAVNTYVDGTLTTKLSLQQEFLNGVIGPRAYNDGLIDLYDDQMAFIEQKMLENPIMTLEGRLDYYKEFGIIVPVMHPMRELLNLYFSIRLEDKIDEETGERVKDWDTFWALREAIESAIPDDLKQEWDDYIARNSTRIEQVRRTVYNEYFKVYNRVWEKALDRYNEAEQLLIREFLYLERTGQKLARQDEIKAMVTKDGRQLISAFRSDVSDARVAFRYANPTLDAWLFYWGRTTSFQAPGAEAIYNQIAKDTGRSIE